MNGEEMREITNGADLIDSRDVIARIQYLRESWADSTGDDPDDFGLSEDDWAVGLGFEAAHELVSLLALAAEAEDYAADWQYGETLIRDSYFEDYARELADDIGAVTGSIDWERAARELRMDYTAVDFDGVTYWIR